MDLKIKIDALQKLVKVLKTFQTPQNHLSDYQLANLFKGARCAAHEVDLENLIQFLVSEEKIINERINIDMEKRRENILSSARSLNISNKRFADYDRIGPLKISYKGKKIKIEIGSEMLEEFEETDGNKVFEKAQLAIKEMEERPFDREIFFRTLKDSIKIAKEHEYGDREGWVPIRTVYTFFILLRHCYIEDFIKKPERYKFSNYSSAQFVYDLARFGQKEWSVGGEMLKSRTPNMATVAAGKTMIIPELRSMEGIGDQIAVMKIEKIGA